MQLRAILETISDQLPQSAACRPANQCSRFRRGNECRNVNTCVTGRILEPIEQLVPETSSQRSNAWRDNGNHGLRGEDHDRDGRILHRFLVKVTPDE